MKPKRIAIIFLLVMLLPVFTIQLSAQSVSINNNSSTPNASAMLDVSSTTKGLLIPRMTTAQRTAITSPATGLQVFDIDSNNFWFYSGSGWVQIAAGGATNYWSLNGTNVFNNTAGNVGIGTNIPTEKLTVQSVGYGITHTDGTITVGTYVGLGKGWLGTKSNHPLTFFTNNSFEQMTLLPNGNFGIGTALPDYRLNVNSNIVQSNTNTNLLKLTGQNPLMSFSNGTTDFGYIKAWSYLPYAPFTNGLVIGSSPGYPIFFSTNNYSVSMIVADNGNVGIGTANPTYKLSVNGNVRSKEVVVETGWADYVFDKKYNLTKLEDVEKFILQNKHLPNIPSAAEVAQNGLLLGDTQKRMMEKIEELTLYIIEVDKQQKRLAEEIIRLKSILSDTPKVLHTNTVNINQ